MVRSGGNLDNGAFGFWEGAYIGNFIGGNKLIRGWGESLGKGGHFLNTTISQILTSVPGVGMKVMELHGVVLRANPFNYPMALLTIPPSMWLVENYGLYTSAFWNKNWKNVPGF